eukprot:CAMPEP_0170610726 /NCGR_PEP_ID=MMETSP0224-20130122/22813_1 /TAXON_ID=285029 /ORGANISM="Togula jolla, Strain CCCM 725" /LENGTH=139 /DNA_ID=CAMNT_0010936121 /DNA_START=127 /DNA_END=546 /DNA_ORIENTATION=-
MATLKQSAPGCYKPGQCLREAALFFPCSQYSAACQYVEHNVSSDREHLDIVADLSMYVISDHAGPRVRNGSTIAEPPAEAHEEVHSFLHAYVVAKVRRAGALPMATIALVASSTLALGVIFVMQRGFHLQDVEIPLLVS